MPSAPSTTAIAAREKGRHWVKPLSKSTPDSLVGSPLEGNPKIRTNRHCASLAGLQRSAAALAFALSAHGGCVAVRPNPEETSKLLLSGPRIEGVLSFSKGEAKDTANGKKASVASGYSSVTRYIVRGATDVGRKRDHNEDSFLVDENLQDLRGRGRHGRPRRRRHRLAPGSRNPASHAARPARRQPRGLPGAHLARDVGGIARPAAQCRRGRLPGDLSTNSGRCPALSRMGTTLTALLLNDRSAFVAHVGDSRLYLIRKGHILQISDDHSLVNEQLKASVITPEEAKSSRFRSVICPIGRIRGRSAGRPAGARD